MHTERKNNIQAARLRARLYLDLALDPLLDLPLVCLGLRAHDTTTPVSLGLLVLVHVTLLDRLDELAEVGLVFAAYLGDGECGGSLERDVSKIYLDVVVSVM